MSRKSLAVIAVAAAGILALALAAWACGTIDNPPGGNGSSTTSTPDSTSTSTATSSSDSSSTTLPAGSISHPTGTEQVVIQVMTGGGFVPIEYNYTLLPQFSLYGDGRVIVPGPTTLEYPGAALPNLQTTVVSEATIQAMLAAAKEVGLFQNGVDYGQPGVTDVGTTTIVINADGTTYTTEIYALGFEDASGLTMEQQQARAAVNDVLAQFSDPSALNSEEITWEPYDFTALAVFSRAIDPATTGSTDIEPNHLPWPLADLATTGEEVFEGLRKTVVTGDDLETLRPLLDQATQITVWESAGAQYNLWFRPLLPDEAAAL